MSVTIDLNADLGEHPETNLDALIMPFLSSCNIACGGHIGNKDSVKSTIKLAKEHSVRVGAHPSFPDKENFGRKVIKINDQELKGSLEEQIYLVKVHAEKVGLRLNHIKPHGALYNLASVDQHTSTLIGEVIKEIDDSLKLYGLAHSVMARTAHSMVIQFVAEAFADRKYLVNKTLMPRNKEGAVLIHEEEVINQANELVFNKRAFAEQWIEINAQSICLHSDTEGSVNLAAKIKKHLERQGAKICPV